MASLPKWKKEFELRKEENSSFKEKENKMVGISSLLADLAYLHKQSEEKLKEIINEIFRLKQELNNLKRKKNKL